MCDDVRGDLSRAHLGARPVRHLREAGARRTIPSALRRSRSARFLERVEAAWGTGAISAELFAPSRASDERFRQSWARFERATP